MPASRAEQIAQEHWDYLENVIVYTLKLKGTEDDEIDRLIDFARIIYIPAIIHGYKHAEEELSVKGI